MPFHFYLNLYKVAMRITNRGWEVYDIFEQNENNHAIVPDPTSNRPGLRSSDLSGSCESTE